MLKKLLLTTCILGIAFAVTAQDPPPPPPGLMIPLPADMVPPPPDAGPEAFDAFLSDVIGLIDKDGDGRISKEELMGWMASFGPPMDGEGPHMDGEGPHGLSEDMPDMEGKPSPPPCSEELRDSELGPQAEDVACGRSESVGNVIFRTVCNTDPYNSNAIVLPEGRAADCFGIEAIRGHNIVFEIVEEGGGLVWDMSMGKDAFRTLVLVGGPGGTTYRINLISADEPDASITVKFIDHPTF
ncbi:MAG: hypothetical protein HN712_14365 [Gemmatimonadetes bacterium]|jgi:hypothetical protein|nr:hypothetical protein [Gemmatimonadota bacterium]MBT6150265.1 hypothetical protein [Gemmatimonadota bacterium]MBT7861503.1 hypothetical protein [Gemmatimonadota bacterium]